MKDSPAPVIDIRSLTYSYRRGEPPTLSDISLAIAAGEYVLVAGASGSGKSTLCRCLTGLIPHFFGGELSGQVMVLGQDMQEVLPHELVPQAAMVFQNPQDQLLAVGVEDDVAFGPQQLGLSRTEIQRRVDEGLRAAGAQALRERTVYGLSSGQQQRVALAGALALRPRILILDEPTSQIDPQGAALFLDAVARLHREQGTTVIVVEHRLAHTLPAADRLLVLDGGRLAWDGDPRRALLSGQIAGLGLSIPPVVSLGLELRCDGYRRDPLPLSVAEAVAALRGEPGGGDAGSH